ncbi:MAG: 4'-phosphopantetheinyl transferase superfamily protein [Chitinophagaceae bacterium]
MPIFEEWMPHPHSLAAIWHIEEEEAFFLDKNSVRAATAHSNIKHPKRRLEHIAGRYLLQHLKEDFPLHQVANDIHDKPRLPDNAYYFSLSHSFPYVAAIISTQEECGIDIQVWKEGMHKIAHMFLSPEEQALSDHENTQYTLAWSAKEAAYKWNGRRGIDFIADLPIKKISTKNTKFSIRDSAKHFDVKICYKGQEISLEAALFKDFAFALLVKDR